MANGHGGDRVPRNPAAVSGPGQFSQRTDGVPARAAGRISGQPYGQGEQANRLLQQANQPAGGPPTPAPNNGQPLSPQAAPGNLPDVFAPTARPGEPITAGAPGGPQIGPQARRDPDMPLRALARKSLETLGYIHPELRMLLERRDLG